jgi:hypothetical protein
MQGQGNFHDLNDDDDNNSIQFFVHSRAEFNSQWPITESAGLQTTTAIRHHMTNKKKRTIRVVCINAIQRSYENEIHFSLNTKLKNRHIGFEVLSAVVTKVSIFWVMAP